MLWKLYFIMVISTHCYFLIVSQTNPAKAYQSYSSNTVTLSTPLSSFQKPLQVRRLVWHIVNCWVLIVRSRC